MAVGPAWTPVWLSAAKENPERQLHFRFECLLRRYEGTSYEGINTHTFVLYQVRYEGILDFNQVGYTYAITYKVSL